MNQLEGKAWIKFVWKLKKFLHLVLNPKAKENGSIASRETHSSKLIYRSKKFPDNYPIHPVAGNTLKNLPPEERPQERLERLGAASLADRELLAMIIRSGTTNKDVLTLADEMIQQAGSLSGLMRWDISDFKKISGIGESKGSSIIFAN